MNCTIYFILKSMKTDHSIVVLVCANQYYAISYSHIYRKMRRTTDKPYACNDTNTKSNDARNGGVKY